MAFPVVESVTITKIDTAATSHPILMPATVLAAELLLIPLANSGTSVVTSPGGGWAELHTTTSTNVRLGTYYKIADGTEDGTTVDFVSGSSSKAVARVYRISNWHGTTPPEVGIAAVGSSTEPNPPSLAPSWGAADTLWLAGFGVVGQVNFAAGYPANYTNGGDDSTTTPTAVTVASAQRELNAASDDPGVGTLNLSANWIAQTVAVRPAIAAQTLAGVLFQNAPTFFVGALSQIAPPAPPSPGGDSNRMGGSGAIRKPPRSAGR